MFEIGDLITTDEQGRGRISVLTADRLVAAPQLYAVFLLWLLSALFEQLPEAGDLPQPKLVFFFDEAHLLFKDASRALLEKVEQVVRLIRSKGVGVWFVTQHPNDVPETILGQLGNRVQHALRAYTVRDQQALRAAARTMRSNPGLDIEQAMAELATGGALVSLLDVQGRPSPTVRAWIMPPASRIGPADSRVLQRLAAESPFALKYEGLVNRHCVAPAQHSPVTRHPPKWGWGARIMDLLFGTIGPRGGRRDGLAQMAVKTGARAFIHKMMRALIQAINKKPWR
jgi:DNA helicase HerA-like ATPase